MLPYLHILIQVESDGSLRALGAFSSKEKQESYLKERRLTEKDVRRDFYNGPFEPEIKAIYAGHRKWNMDRYQLGGYFQTEGEAWNSVTQEGYVSVLRVDTTYAEEKEFEEKALKLYEKLQRRWRLTSYKDLVRREGSAKTNANITLRFYVDALESFKPKTQRDTRALYALLLLVPIFPLAILYTLGKSPKYGESVDSVKWLPRTASDISFYRSEQISVYEFTMNRDNFLEWAKLNEMTVRRIAVSETLSRYKAYLPIKELQGDDPETDDDDDFTDEALSAWQEEIQAVVEEGLIARNKSNAVAIFDPDNERVYFERLGIPKIPE